MVDQIVTSKTSANSCSSSRSANENQTVHLNSERKERKHVTF